MKVDLHKIILSKIGNIPTTIDYFFRLLNLEFKN